MDQLREDTRERTWEDYVETAGAALAIGAGAAHFLMNGGVQRLSRFSEYIAGARASWARGHFDNWNIEGGLRQTKRIADKLKGHASAIDIQNDPLFATPFRGADIRAEGVEYSRMSGKLERAYKTEYGLTIMNQMLGSDSMQYMNENQMGHLRNMVSKFTGGEEISTPTIMAEIRRKFGEDASVDAIAEATRFAVETQRMMRSDAMENMIKKAGKNQRFSMDVGTFLGFDDAGQGLWDMNNIVRHYEEENPVQRTFKAATEALNIVAIKEHEERLYSGPLERIKERLLGKRVNFGEVKAAIDANELSKDVFARRVYKRKDGNALFSNTFDAAVSLRDQYFAGDAAAEFDKLIVNNLRRGSDGKIYSTAGIESMLTGAGDLLSDTLPGKMLRMTELLYNRQKPVFEAFTKGTLDYSLATTLGNNKSELAIAKNLMWMHGRLYEEAGIGWEASERLKNFTLITNRIGTARDMMKGVRDAQHANAAGKKFFDNFFREHTFVVRKMTEEYGNQYDWALSPNVGANDPWLNTMNRMYRFFGTLDQHSTLQKELNAGDLKRLRAGFKSQKLDTSAISTALQIIQDPTGEHAIRYASQYGSISSSGSIMNESLSQLLADFRKNALRTEAQHITHADQTKKTAFGVYYYSQPFRENLAQELVREAFLKASNGGKDIDKVEALLQNFRGEKASNLRSFVAASIFQHQTFKDVYGVSLEERASEAIKILRAIQENNPNRTKTEKFIFDSFSDLQKRFNFKSSIIFPGENVGYSTLGEAWDKVPDWAVIHKSYSFGESFRLAASMVQQSNEKTRGRALINAAREAVKPITQLWSGNDMFGALSPWSIAGYRTFNLVDEQLNRSFNLFGRHFELNLGLNKRDKGSGFEIAKNLILKRVAPAAFAITYLDFIDDTARAVLGQGLGEAGLSGLANAYLAAKKVTGATGLDYALKGLSSDNPLFQYYAGYTGGINAEWNTYEEQKDYYERGYTPIRKARFWKFGSTNEYRGGRVSYFEPNTLRMMRSNYFMESMYEGSMWTKWSHSLLPTPLNPLSPLNYFLDPYYLEELHKEDRPYPITGSTFAENTPWGIALNPIFDAFVKPRKRMHQDRLGSDGVDVKALIAHVNDNIRRRANNQQNGDILYLQNGKLRSMLFTAFNAPTPSERIIGQQGVSVTTSTEYGEYGAGISADEYASVTEANTDQLVAGSMIGIPAQSEKLSVSDRLVISSAKGNFVAGTLVDTMKVTGVFDALRGANMKIRQQGMLRKDQGFFYENKMQYEHSAVDDLLADSETISDLMTQGKGHDYIHEMAVSTRMITGLYGYMASLAFGMGQNNQKMIATSANMESGGRAFWDLGVGGFDPTGGDIMEIMRRFIPEYHRMQQVNPLMNTMPDWLPERMRFGDPYAAIPKGEARLPGRGYESLNQLHPDIYGRYGAFDRFKILADVAPYSPEYKFWKKVVGATIQDPTLKKEIQEIKDRVAEQTQGHDFYDYKYVGRSMEQQNAVVSEILNFGKFKIVGSEQVYKLSGVKIAGNPNETTQQVLSRYLLPGQEITMYTDANPAYARNNDRDQTINAGVMVAGENIAEQMLEAGDAKKRKGDISSTSYMLKHGGIVSAINYVSEVIGHANIPVLHSRWLNMNTPLESYLDDNVYGTAFQSWSRPWETYARPSLQIEASSPTWLSIGIISDIVRNNVKNEGKTHVRNIIREMLENAGYFKGQASAKWLSRTTWAARLLDRGALMGSIVGGIGFMGSSGYLQKVERMQKIGSVIGLMYAAEENPNSLAVSTLSLGRLGYLIGNEVMHKNRALMTATGVALGAIRWASSKKLLASEDTANTYIPDETRKKWDMQEYFDRLTYIKYRGLFEQAADMALEKEGVDIRAILAAQEQERQELLEQKETLQRDLRDLDNRHTAEAEEAKKLIRKRINQMKGAKLGIRGGEFTKSAIMYKNAADATIYGLDENALMADIVRALPKTERDYFIEFMQEKDKEKREEILSTVSPLLNRALRTIWKMPLPEKVSNEEYFEHHTLPAPTWAGWRPDIDLANVEAKVIYNQGMQFSDMGIYASQYRDPAVINAPNIEYNESQNSMLLTRLKLQMALTGTGIDASTVSVEPSQDSGLQIVANIAKIIPYKIGEEFENLFNFG